MSHALGQCFANHLEVSELWPANSLMWEGLTAKIIFGGRTIPRLGGRLRV